MAGNLTFLPGTMCDQRVWAPVRARLEPQFSTDYIAIETERTREAMLGLNPRPAALQPNRPAAVLPWNLNRRPDHGAAPRVSTRARFNLQ